MALEERSPAEEVNADFVRISVRFKAASGYGFDDDEATAFAYSDIELSQLLWLRDTGCDPRLAVRILL